MKLFLTHNLILENHFLLINQIRNIRVLFFFFFYSRATKFSTLTMQQSKKGQ